MKNKTISQPKKVKKTLFDKLLDEYLLNELGYDLERIKFILANVSIVYCEITGGKLSRPYYPASTIISEYEEYLTRLKK